MTDRCIPMEEKRRRIFSIFQKKQKGEEKSLQGSLAMAQTNHEYEVQSIETENEEMKNFLFTLGCYEGEKITLISRIADQYVIVIKDARYSIDKNLANCIKI